MGGKDVVSRALEVVGSWFHVVMVVRWLCVGEKETENVYGERVVIYY